MTDVPQVERTPPPRLLGSRLVARERDGYNDALAGLRQSGQLDDLPKALLTAALRESVRGEGERVAAEQYLVEAQQIAQRGPLPLYLADIHLHRAHILAWVSSPDAEGKSQSHAELATARARSEKHKYGRRRPELADAETLLEK